MNSIHILTFTHFFFLIKQKQRSCGRVVEKNETLKGLNKIKKKKPFYGHEITVSCTNKATLPYLHRKEFEDKKKGFTSYQESFTYLHKIESKNEKVFLDAREIVSMILCFK